MGFGFPTLGSLKRKDLIMPLYHLNTSPFSLVAPRALTLCSLFPLVPLQQPPIPHSHLLFVAQDSLGGGGGVYDYSRLLVGVGVQFHCFKVGV